jgi:hypothetical protein
VAHGVRALHRLGVCHGCLSLGSIMLQEGAVPRAVIVALDTLAPAHARRLSRDTPLPFCAPEALRAQLGEQAVEAAAQEGAAAESAGAQGLHAEGPKDGRPAEDGGGGGGQEAVHGQAGSDCADGLGAAADVWALGERAGARLPPALRCILHALRMCARNHESTI